MHRLSTPNALIIIPKTAPWEIPELVIRFDEGLDIGDDVEVPPEDEVLVEGSTAQAPFQLATQLSFDPIMKSLPGPMAVAGISEGVFGPEA
jgi:hypothetical protein